ncbi:MAG: hypothetical protein HGA75_13235, partial [Thiobacillus sp.]|nr:hypothetical protein [Thiobacillus sp.]
QAAFDIDHLVSDKKGGRTVDHQPLLQEIDARKRMNSRFSLAVDLEGEGLRGLLAGRGIGVTVICPGFVATAMSDAYPCPRPFLVPAERAAAIIRAGLARNRARIAFPWPLALAMWFLALLPPSASLFLQRLFRFA